MWKKLMNLIAPEVETAAPGIEITRKHWIFLWAAAALILFCRLGVADINGSEGRWLAVADEMLKSGDFLHPTINGHAYFDKPLVSYWFIAATARLCGGVSELTARIPSALAALLALASVISLTRKFYGARTALAAGWALVSTYSFIYWGRLAEADMENAAFIIAATAWYFHCRERKSVRCYALFWSICAVGAQTKGLAAFVIPAMVAGADMLLTHKLKYHLNRRAALGLICGLAVYLIPFALETASRGDYNASGIWLVFRENIIRAIDPWDHKDEPFWCYFLYLPRLMLPWAPVLVLALAEYIRRVVRKSATDADKWLLASIGLIFLLFSCSRSRRVYYILPAIPYCAMLCGRFLTDPGTDWAARLNRALLRIADCVLLTAPAAALAGMLILQRDLTRPVICWMTLCIVLSSVGFAILWRRTRRTDKPRVFPAIPETARTIGIVYSWRRSASFCRNFSPPRNFAAAGTYSGSATGRCMTLTASRRKIWRFSATTTPTRYFIWTSPVPRRFTREGTGIFRRFSPKSTGKAEPYSDGRTNSPNFRAVCAAVLSPPTGSLPRRGC